MGWFKHSPGKQVPPSDFFKGTCIMSTGAEFFRKYADTIAEAEKVGGNVREKALMPQFNVLLTRETLQYAHVTVRAIDADAASVRALDHASSMGDNLEWYDSDYLGDTEIGRIEPVQGRNT